MNATRTIPEHFRVVITLAHMLQQLEGSTVPVGADQYRSVVRHLSDELTQLPVDDDLHAVLAAYPAATELYENLNYAYAGLCRSPLDSSLSAELKAKEAIDRARRGGVKSPGP